MQYKQDVTENIACYVPQCLKRNVKNPLNKGILGFGCACYTRKKILSYILTYLEIINILLFYLSFIHVYCFSVTFVTL